MTILVTGGTGSVGREAVARLVRKGQKVRVIGRRSGLEIQGAEYQACDITDFEALRQQMVDVEAVVHLAAIPAPTGGTGQEIFRVNCLGTLNVYHAAADAGVERVVSASSINAFGYNYGIRSFELQYFPIDEEHPTYTTDPYSFSKQVLEETAAYFWRREGISGVSLRLPGVYEAMSERMKRFAEHVLRFREAFEELMSLSEEARQERVRGAIAQFDASRSDRARPMPREEMIRRWRTYTDDPDMVLLFGAFGRSNFWASIDARDSALAIECGLSGTYEGSHSLFVNDSQNAAGVPSETLAQVFFPQVKARKHPLQGAESLVCIERARALIGFEPQHPIREWIESVQ